MSDLSTERLDPAARVPEPQRQQGKHEPQSRPRRRSAPPPPRPEAHEPPAEPEGDAHQLDRLA